MNKFPFSPGQILKFFNPASGTEYDGIIWRVLPEDETNYSIIIRYVDEVI